MPRLRAAAALLAALVGSLVPAATAQQDECTDACDTCANGWCRGRMQACEDPDPSTPGDWTCVCLGGIHGEGRATAAPAACTINECTDAQPLPGDAVCAAPGGPPQRCIDSNTSAPMLAGNATATVVPSVSRGAGQLVLGEGGCLADSDCGRGLFCFINDGGRIEVPGVDTTGLPADVSICAFPFLMPLPPYVGDNPQRRLGVGEGDCDSDADCEDGLLCWRRGAVRVGNPGIEEAADPDTDFCYKKARAVAQPIAGALRLGEGPCTAHSDCADGLHCFFRHAPTAGVPVPGIDTGGIGEGVSVCYRRPDLAPQRGGGGDWVCECDPPNAGRALAAAAFCGTPLPPTAAPPTEVPRTFAPGTAEARGCFTLPLVACRTRDAAGCMLTEDYRDLIVAAMVADGVAAAGVPEQVDARCVAKDACVDGCEVSVGGISGNAASSLLQCNFDPPSCPELERKGLKIYGARVVTDAPPTGAPVATAAPNTTSPVGPIRELLMCLDKQKTGVEGSTLRGAARRAVRDAVAADTRADVDAVEVSPRCPDTGSCQPNTLCGVAIGVPERQFPNLVSCSETPGFCRELSRLGVMPVTLTPMPTPAPNGTDAAGSPGEGDAAAPGDGFPGWAVTLIVVLLVCCVAIAIAALLMIKKREKRRRTEEEVRAHNLSRAFDAGSLPEAKGLDETFLSSQAGSEPTPYGNGSQRGYRYIPAPPPLQSIRSDGGLGAGVEVVDTEDIVATPRRGPRDVFAVGSPFDSMHERRSPLGGHVVRSPLSVASGSPSFSPPAALGSMRVRPTRESPFAREAPSSPLPPMQSFRQADGGGRGTAV